MNLLHLRWPPRAVAWAILAFSVLPAGLLSERIVQLLYPPLALVALLLPAPAGRARFALDRGLLWPLLAIFLWGLVSILWTTAPEYAVERWPAALGLTVLTLASLGAAASATADERRLVGWALTIGFAIGFALTVSEIVTDAAIYRSRYGWENTPADAQSEYSRHLMLFALAAFALANLLPAWARLLPALAVLELTLLFDHQGGTLGLLAAMAVWLLATWRRSALRPFWTVVLALALLVSPFQGLLLQSYVTPRLEEPPRALLVRQQIWRLAAERALEKPVIGWGFEASERIPNRGELSLQNPRPTKRIVSGHPHNVFLQLWLELGIVGVALGGWFLLRLRDRIATPLAQALLAYTLMPALLSSGLWRSHTLAILCCGIVLYRLLAPGPGNDEARAAPVPDRG